MPVGHGINVIRQLPLLLASYRGITFFWLRACGATTHGMIDVAMYPTDEWTGTFSSEFSQSHRRGPMQ